MTLLSDLCSLILTLSDHTSSPSSLSTASSSLSTILNDHDDAFAPLLVLTTTSLALPPHFFTSLPISSQSSSPITIPVSKNSPLAVAVEAAPTVQQLSHAHVQLLASAIATWCLARPDRLSQRPASDETDAALERRVLLTRHVLVALLAHAPGRTGLPLADAQAALVALSGTPDTFSHLLSPQLYATLPHPSSLTPYDTTSISLSIATAFASLCSAKRFSGWFHLLSRAERQRQSDIGSAAVGTVVGTVASLLSSASSLSDAGSQIPSALVHLALDCLSCWLRNHPPGEGKMSMVEVRQLMAVLMPLPALDSSTLPLVAESLGELAYLLSLSPHLPLGLLAPVVVTISKWHQRLHLPAELEARLMVEVERHVREHEPLGAALTAATSMSIADVDQEAVASLCTLLSDVGSCVAPGSTREDEAGQLGGDDATLTLTVSLSLCHLWTWLPHLVDEETAGIVAAGATGSWEEVADRHARLRKAAAASSLSPALTGAADAIATATVTYLESTLAPSLCLPADYEGTSGAFDADDPATRRSTSLTHSLRAAAHILTGEAVFMFFTKRLEGAVQAGENGKARGDEGWWVGAESCMWALRTLVATLPLPCAAATDFLTSLSSLSSTLLTHPLIRRTTVLLLGRLSLHLESAPSSLPTMLDVIVGSLTTAVPSGRGGGGGGGSVRETDAAKQARRLADAGAHAFMNLCKDAAPLVASHWPTLLSLAESMSLPSAGTPDSSLSASLSLKVMEGLASVAVWVGWTGEVGADSQWPGTAAAALLSLASPTISALSHPPPPTSPTHALTLAHSLDLAVALVDSAAAALRHSKSLSLALPKPAAAHLLSSTANQLLSLSLGLLQHGDESVAMATCRLIEHVCTGLTIQLSLSADAGFTPSLTASLCGALAQAGSSDGALLQLPGRLLERERREVEDDGTTSPSCLGPLCMEVLAVAVPRLGEVSVSHSLADHPPAVAAFFSFAEQLTLSLPQLTLGIDAGAEVAPHIFDLALASCCAPLPHPALRQIFLYLLCLLSTPHRLMERQQRGQAGDGQAAGAALVALFSSPAGPVALTAARRLFTDQDRAPAPDASLTRAQVLLLALLAGIASHLPTPLFTQVAHTLDWLRRCDASVCLSAAHDALAASLPTLKHEAKEAFFVSLRDSGQLDRAVGEFGAAARRRARWIF